MSDDPKRTTREFDDDPGKMGPDKGEGAEVYETPDPKTDKVEDTETEE